MHKALGQKHRTTLISLQSPVEDCLHSPKTVPITLMQRVMLVGAIPPTVQECVWTNLQEKSKSWKCVDCLIYSMKMGLPRTAIYGVCQCTATRKTEKRD